MTDRKKTVDVNGVINLIKSAQRILLCAHLQPDGDAIGSLLAMQTLVKRLGKEATAICHDPVPDNLHVLEGFEEVRRPADVAGQDVDLFISLDCSDQDRLGDAAPLFDRAPSTLVIDHHASNTCFGMYNYVDTQVAATGNLVFRLYEAAQVAFDPRVASWLYAALSSDTGNFSFGQMDAEFFQQMSTLMQAGLDIVHYARLLHLMKEKVFYKLLGRALSSLSFFCDGKASCMRLTQQDFLAAGTTSEHMEGLVNYALNIPGVQMCFIASETEDRQVKFSLRAIKPNDVSVIASEFGGGGHVLAAGCNMNLPFEEAVARMQERMQQALCP